MTDTSELIDGAVAAEPGPAPEPEPATDPATRRWRMAFGLAVIAVVALVGSQVLILQTLRDTNADLDGLGSELREVGVDVGRLDAAIEGVGGNVAGLQGEVAGVGERITSLEEQRLALAPGPSSASSEEDATQPTDGVTVVAATLPRFQGDSNNDPALGMTLGEVAGPEYYSAQNVSYSPTDGISRAIFVWAHWCPYCQQEIPEIAQWLGANAADYQNFEIVSVTTAIDENGPNPLFPYLDDNQWPFPVIVDDTGALASQLGVNAFPFWVFVGPDGTVLGRTAGALPLAQLDGIFMQLETIGAGA